MARRKYGVQTLVAVDSLHWDYGLPLMCGLHLTLPLCLYDNDHSLFAKLKGSRPLHSGV